MVPSGRRGAPGSPARDASGDRLQGTICLPIRNDEFLKRIADRPAA